MLSTTKRPVSLLNVALSIVVSMALLLMAAWVSAREPTRTAAPANDTQSTPSVGDVKPKDTSAGEPPKPPKVTRGAAHRMPVCARVVAKIVSQNKNPARSLASLSYDSGTATLVRIGSPVGEQRVVAIGYDGNRMSPRVVLSGEQGLCQAMTFERAEATAQTRATRSGSPRPARSDHTEIVVDRSAVDAILERSFELTRGVQVLPEMKDGSVAAIRLMGIRRGSLLSALGLENGDSVVRINGQAMTTPEAALSFYSNIRSLEHFEIEITRAGKPARVEIRIT
jgi:3-methyladenine DNA glycosylase Mpg